MEYAPANLSKTITECKKNAEQKQGKCNLYCKKKQVAENKKIEVHSISGYLPIIQRKYY